MNTAFLRGTKSNVKFLIYIENARIMAIISTHYKGCSGWSYTSWEGPFYPSNLDNKSWLPYYSQVFNYVEVDSTFYYIPSELMVRNWNRSTTENFRFTAKLPKIITHDKKIKNVIIDPCQKLSLQISEPKSSNE
jgi:uncharacterized protein YecE (DUF72 family)